jgi:predicted transposase YbfD/YdcC
MDTDMFLLEQIEELTDERKDINLEYDLADIVFLTMVAVLSGAKGWKAIKIFGEAQIDWLRQYRPFTNGIPTRHSIGRIIRGIKSDCFVTCFLQGVNHIREHEGKEHLAFDGKVLRGSKHGDNDNALQLMTAMVVESGFILYQKETSDKTNEIPVMQSMLQCMDIKGSVITADAMHCQTKTSDIVIDGGGDYILQVKKNQKKLYDEIQAFFHKTDRDEPELFEGNCFNELDGEHGRINERQYRRLVITDWLSEGKKFKKSYAVIEVQRTRTIKDELQQETSYYIASLVDSIGDVSGYIRRHWAIENSQHWVLDVTFREDECQIYAEDGARNLATIRRHLLNLVKAHPLKDSVAGKLQRASWDGNFRAEILFGQ